MDSPYPKTPDGSSSSTSYKVTEGSRLSNRSLKLLPSPLRKHNEYRNDYRDLRRSLSMSPGSPLLPTRLEFVDGDERDSSSGSGRKRSNRLSSRLVSGRRKGIAGTYVVVGGLVCLISLLLMLLSLADIVFLENLKSAVAATTSRRVAAPILQDEVVTASTDSPSSESEPWPFHPMHPRLLAMAAHHLADNQAKADPPSLWTEVDDRLNNWKPCSANRVAGRSGGGHGSETDGYVMVTLGGGLSQKRIGVCNAVAIAKLLNATLVIPRFTESEEKFSDVFDEAHFMASTELDVPVVRKLPEHLASLDLLAMKSVVLDSMIPRQSPMASFLVLRRVLRTSGVIHFYGFVDRVASDPLPFLLQRVRCYCNFHALRFTPPLMLAAQTAIQRMRQGAPGTTRQLSGVPGGPNKNGSQDAAGGRQRSQSGALPAAGGEEASGKEQKAQKRGRFVVLHLSFEPQVAAMSMCRFGGGEEEWLWLQRLREQRFPKLRAMEKRGKLKPPYWFRNMGLCPLAPEEMALTLVSLGFRRDTKLFIAGSRCLSHSHRMTVLGTLYPSLATINSALTHTELQPFINSSLMLAALDFLVSVAADVFVGSDLNSQSEGVISGFRTYRRGAMGKSIFAHRNVSKVFNVQNTLEWADFVEEIQTIYRQSQGSFTRPFLRSVFRHPRCHECMCEKAAASNGTWLDLLRDVPAEMGLNLSTPSLQRPWNGSHSRAGAAALRLGLENRSNNATSMASVGEDEDYDEEDYEDTDYEDYREDKDASLTI